MTSEGKGASRISSSTPVTTGIQQSGNVQLVSALVAEYPELAQLWSQRELDELLRDYARRLVWAGRLGQTGKGM